MPAQRELQFAEAYKRLTPVLTRIFSRAVSKYGGDRAGKADDLVQITAEQALKNSRLDKYAHYPVEALIWIKAYNILYAYHRSTQKQALSVSAVAELASPLPDPHQYLQLREVQQYLHKHVAPLTWQICVLVLEGWSYGQIGKITNRSEGAIKMRLLRLRQTLKQQDLRPD
jgi:RNA polymerase sigma factor (sigma-70 family)